MVTRDELLTRLPPFERNYVLIHKEQGVYDIVKEVCEAHKFFAQDYDQVSGYFNYKDVTDICKRLFDFCKDNIRYSVEDEESQTTKSPAAIIALGEGDCKHYAGWIAGILDSLKRKGRNIDWSYRFASYRPFDSTPQHVFVVVKKGGKEIWIDPVLQNFNQRLQPTFQPLDKKVNMPLYRVSGIGNAPDIIGNFPVQENIPAQTVKDVMILSDAGIIDPRGNVDVAQLKYLNEFTPENQFRPYGDAMARLMTDATISGLFDGIVKAWKKVALLLPRNAFLSLVGINAFNYATKIKRAISDPEGKAKLKKMWEGLGGDFGKLENTVNDGAKKKAILGDAPDIIGAAPAALPAWVATASAIVAAFMPVVKAILDKIGPGNMPQLPGEYPTGEYPGEYSTGGGIMEWVQNNPAITMIGVAGVAYLLLNKKR